MRFGPNSAKVTVLRRPVVPGNPHGVSRASFEPAFETWASWRSLSGREIVEAGMAEDAIDLAVRVHDTPRNRTITGADRIKLRGQEFNIVTVALPDRIGGFIEFSARRNMGG